jgi:hypothetical protein
MLEEQSCLHLSTTTNLNNISMKNAWLCVVLAFIPIKVFRYLNLKFK